MSKERLEEIKNNSTFEHLRGRFMISLETMEYLIEQAERVQELEERYEIHLDLDINNEHKIRKLEQQNMRYRELLDRLCETEDFPEVWDIIDDYRMLEQTP